jgi:hypothetical protein
MNNVAFRFLSTFFRRKKRTTASTTMRTFFGIFVFVTCFIVFFLAKSYQPACRDVVVTNCLIVIGSIAIMGFLLGFLFGIPRSIRYRFDKTKNNFSNNDSDAGYFADNTNLEEISDWITKIIVGLTLIKARVILGYLDLSAHSIANSFPDGGGLYVFSYSLIIFFGGLGFLGGYLWTRTLFGSILTQSRAEQNEDMFKLANRNLSNNEGVANENNITEEGRYPLVEFKNKVQELLKTNSVKHFDDSQKDRWGGVASANGRILSATVTQSLLGFFDVTIEVTSTLDKPLDKTVVILLDSTFPEDVIYLNPSNNRVKVRVVAYEAFTIAALCDDTETKLELDLQLVKGYPEKFYY